jgi:hypothetical protein
MVLSISIGDVISVCQLITIIAISLSECREQPQDYEELVMELDTLYWLFEDVKKLYTPFFSDSMMKAYEPIRRQIKTCENDMNEFVEKISPPNKWYRKVWWGFLASSRAASLRRKLAIHRQTLVILLGQ